MARAKKEADVVNEVVEAPKPKRARVKKAASPKITLKDDVLYVLLRRQGLFGWQAFQLFETEAAAVEAREYYEKGSIYGTKGYKVDRVVLQRKTIDELLESLETP